MTVFPSDVIGFVGQASDNEDDMSDLVVTWISDKDGVLSVNNPQLDGLINTEISNLSLNEHNIKMAVEDRSGGIS